MGVDLTDATFIQLWELVLKRCIYLLAKFISFKGAAFVVCCIFRAHDIISGAVWGTTIIGIITNRTGWQYLERKLRELGDYADEAEYETDAGRTGRYGKQPNDTEAAAVRAPRSTRITRSVSTGTAGSTAADAERRIRAAADGAKAGIRRFLSGS